MRRWRAIAHTAALELLGEPLCLLVTLAALSLAVFAPSLHCHQFGEPSRMARDAGFSSILLGGMIYGVFGALRTFRREVDSRTLQVILAHPVSPASYFVSKTAGCLLAYFVFALTVIGVSLTVVRGAEIGGQLAAASGAIPRLWGPSLALSSLPVVLSVSLAAAMNRFAGRRFVLWSNLLSLGLALAGIVYRFDAALAARFIPAAILFAMPPVVMLTASAAFSVRFRSNVSLACTALAALAFVPALGNYCLSDALARGGCVPLPYFLLASAACAASVAFFVALGAVLANGKDAE